VSNITGATVFKGFVNILSEPELLYEYNPNQIRNTDNILIANPNKDLKVISFSKTVFISVLSTFKMIIVDSKLTIMIASDIITLSLKISALLWVFFYCL